MNHFLLVCIIFSGMLFLVANIFFWISWSIHKDMTCEQTSAWGYGSFDDFLREFQNKMWDNKGWPKSLFNYETDSQIHASIFQFNGKGMVIKPTSWIKVNLYLRKFCNKSPAKYKKDLWK